MNLVTYTYRAPECRSNLERFKFQHSLYKMLGEDFGWYNPDVDYEDSVTFASCSGPILSVRDMSKLAHECGSSIEQIFK